MKDTVKVFKTDDLLPDIENFIHTIIKGHGIVYEIMNFHFLTGGKRIRARLALEAALALGIEPKKCIPWAAACEILHNATLIHDDVQDGDKTRRGQPTVWFQYGINQAINAGDMLLMLPFSAIKQSEVFSDSLKWKLSNFIAESAQRIVQGQAQEATLIKQLKSPNINDLYTNCIKGKTASLFSLPVQGAYAIANIETDHHHVFIKTSEILGLLFQIQDDILDLYGDKGRDAVGNDIREGKVSLLVIEHIKAHPEDHDWLFNILQSPRLETTDEQVFQVIDKFKASGALERSLKKLDQLSTEIEAQLVTQEPSHLKKLFRQSVELILKPIEHLL